jgi:hypothetical protein
MSSQFSVLSSQSGGAVGTDEAVQHASELRELRVEPNSIQEPARGGTPHPVLGLQKGAPGDVEEPPLISGPLSTVGLGDVGPYRVSGTHELGPGRPSIERVPGDDLGSEDVCKRARTHVDGQPSEVRTCHRSRSDDQPVVRPLRTANCELRTGLEA